MRALMTATVPSMIGQFNMNNIKLLQELGYEVDVACNFDDRSVWTDNKINEFKITLVQMNISLFQIDFERKLTSLNHIKAYHQIKKLLNNRKYKLIHTHTPISSLITRIAFKYSKIKCECTMIYTAHGFHFFKGNNPVKNWAFKAIEKIGAKQTDVLITINKEDYEAAKKMHLRNKGRVEYVPGVGVDIDKVDSVKPDRGKLLNELGISRECVLLLSVGELNENKNHKYVIECLPNLPRNFHYLICGCGKLEDIHKCLAKEIGVENRLHLLGYRNNIIEIMKSCDIFIFPSKREGLSVALMEAMACGLPCIVSNIRGNTDLINPDLNGYFLELESKISKDIIDNCMSKKDSISKNNMQLIKKYSKKSIADLMFEIYKGVSLND